MVEVHGRGMLECRGWGRPFLSISVCSRGPLVFSRVIVIAGTDWLLIVVEGKLLFWVEVAGNYMELLC